MATTYNEPVVNYDEPPIKPPPILAVGPIAWVRTNLFRSAFDTVVTFVSVALLVAVVVGMINWIIGAANWFVVTSNFRLLLAGTFPAESLWRLEWAARLCALVAGFTLMAYTRVRRGLVIALVVLVALLLVVPPVIDAAVPPAYTYLAVGDTAIVSGTVSEKPQNPVAFVGRGGDAVSIRLADADTETALADSAGFADRASNAAFNAARNRLESLSERSDLQFRLNHALLTDAQRADLTKQIDNLKPGDPVTDSYAINAQPVTVALLDRDGSTIASGTLSADSAPLTATLPADGWYVLQKQSAGTVLLAAQGIYPLHEVNFTRALPSGGSESVTQYARITDGFAVENPPPSADGKGGKPLPELLFNDTRYTGTRPVSDYLSLFIAPFFRTLGWPVTQLVLLGTLGYLAGVGLRRVLPGDRNERMRRIRGVVAWLWLLYLIALFLLCYGIANLDAVGAGLLLSRFAWVGLMYFTGMNHDRSWGRPLLALVTLLGLVQAVIGEGLPAKLSSPAALIVALVGVILWLLVGWYAAGMGRNARENTPDGFRLRGLVGAAVVWLILFIVPPLLIAATSDNTNNVLPVVDTRRWGGFMLTALLTIVGILASFPLGVLLALGRRSGLPVVRWTCIAFIELVRGVPLITVLFMAQLLVPLVNPSLANVDNVFRAMVGVTLFSAAYLAENVRGGLQAIPHGQEEAAKALGLGSYQITLLILLPQALRIVIPALVGQAIALFKDTSLVALVGLIDLTGMATSLLAQAEYNGLQSEVYLFVSVIYFGFSYLMAWVSRRIEASGSGAARRV